MNDILVNIFKDQKTNVIFSCFGIWHILYMIIIFCMIISLLFYLKNKSDERKQKTINIIINIVFSLYMLDFFIMPLSYGTIDIEKLPFHICTVTCVLCFLSRHIQFFGKFKLQFALLALIGNFIYVVYPAGVGWYKIAPYSYRVIQTLMFHGLMCLYSILTIIYDNKELKFKNCYKEMIISVFIIIWAIIGNSIYNTESRLINWFFVIRDPFYILPETISPFIMPFVMVFIVFIVDMLFYLVYNLSKKFLRL